MLFTIRPSSVTCYIYHAPPQLCISQMLKDFPLLCESTCLRWSFQVVGLSDLLSQRMSWRSVFKYLVYHNHLSCSWSRGPNLALPWHNIQWQRFCLDLYFLLCKLVFIPYEILTSPCYPEK